MPARRKWEKEYTRSLNMSFSRTKTGTQATFCPKYKKKEMYYGRTCNCKAFGKCLKLCQWDKYSCTEGRSTDRAHTKLFTAKQGAKTLQEQMQHYMHRKEMQMQLRLQIFHKGDGDPSCRSIHPFRKVRLQLRLSTLQQMKELLLPALNRAFFQTPEST